MQFRNKELSALQRQSLRFFLASLIATIFLTIGVHDEFQRTHPPAVFAYLLAIVPALPIIFAIVIIWRYLSRENDEFIRMLVIQAMLWGFGVTMVADTVVGFLIQYLSVQLPLGILNFDVFLGSAAIALRLQMWRNR